MTIFIIRHGDVEYPRNEKGEKLIYGPDVLLTEEGKRQIQQTADTIKTNGDSIAVLYSSPFIRAKQSAEIISKTFNIQTIHEDKRLQDTDAPLWVGRPIEELHAMHARGHMYDSSLDGESLDHVAQRMKEAFFDIFHKEKEHIFAIVSHGDPIRSLIHVLEYPSKPFSGVEGFYRHDYLKKGEAWKLILNEQGNLLQKTLIPRSGDSNPGSRDY